LIAVRNIDSLSILCYFLVSNFYRERWIMATSELGLLMAALERLRETVGPDKFDGVDVAADHAVVRPVRGAAQPLAADYGKRKKACPGTYAGKSCKDD
jgi:hypothetical protein